MRGKDEKITLEGMTSRITPAYAGKSNGKIQRRFKKGDHPRLCGEKLLRENGLVYEIRITPAYAGKSLVVAGVCYDKQDHPRLCGEKFISPQSIVTNLGSPPPMRGKGKQSLNYVDVDRITPAYAGKSGINCNQIPVTGDHPRLCGEKVYNMKKVYR